MGLQDRVKRRLIPKRLRMDMTVPVEGDLNLAVMFFNDEPGRHEISLDCQSYWLGLGVAVGDGFFNHNRDHSVALRNRDATRHLKLDSNLALDEITARR